MIEKDRANGELAYFLNSNSAGTWRVSNGETVFADQSNATYRVALNRNASNGSLIESAFAYVNAGESYTIPSYENYTLDESSLPAGTSEGTFVMPAEDVTISYTLQGVDLGIVQGIIDKYAVYDVDLFTQAEEIKTVVQSAQDIPVSYTHLIREPIRSPTAAIILQISIISLWRGGISRPPGWGWPARG